MQITITDDVFYIIMGLLFIAFLPHIHLFLIFTAMNIADSFEYMAKLINKFIKSSLDHLFPIFIIFLFYLAILKIFVTVFNSILGHV
jgi:hypothetical protein